MVLITHLVYICLGTIVSGLLNEAKHKQAFGKLLNSIVKLNEKRIDAMIKLYSLQQYNVATKLRVGKEIKEEPKDDRPVVLIYADEKPVLRNKSKNKKHISKKKRSVEAKKYPKGSPEKNNAVGSDDYSKDSVEKRIPNKANDDKKEEILKIGKEDNILLRKSWRSSCDKKAAKMCRKACCNAYKNVCATFKCKSKLKKKFKNECKKSCKASFRDSGSNSSGSSSSGSD